MKKDTRNIIDYYKYWSTDAIKAELDQKRYNFSIFCSNLHNDFNISQIVRCGNAFLAKEIIVYGKKSYDKRGTVGTHHYTNFKYVRSIDEDEENFNQIFSEFDLIVGIDNVDYAEPINDFNWDKNKNTLICFGQEQVGLPKEIIDKCDHMLYIKQYGSVRSLNVGCCAGIVMYDYTSKIC